MILRLWTFTMSCCISSAVCCTLVTASMSGVALGYNYSLAEYIDLKETNVSVYLKRGVFDDDIADDVDWRRSGHLPVQGHIGDQNLLTGPPDEESSPLRAGRRLDDSIFESNDKNNFEGALMKLTAKPPAERTSQTVPQMNLDEIERKLPENHLVMDKLKAIQSAINMQKAQEAERRLKNKNTQSSQLDSGRRMLPRVSINIPPDDEPTSINSLRLAVPDQGFHNPGNWIAPKFQAKVFTTSLFDDYSEPISIPSPITAKPRPIRPSSIYKPKPTVIYTPTMTSQRPSYKSEEVDLPKDFKGNFEDVNQQFLLDKFDDPSFRDEELAHKKKKGPNQSEEDYEDDIKGIPIRKKRDLTTKDREIEFNESSVYLKQTIMSKLNNLASSLFDAKKGNVIPKIHETAAGIDSISKNIGEFTDSTFMRLVMSSTMS